MQNNKDSQNQYRSGVLIANHVEDRVGQDLIGSSTNWKFPKSEAKDRYDLGNSMFGAGRNGFKEKPTTEDAIASEEGAKEQEAKTTIFTKKGQPGHILMGHGANQDSFEKRDFGTTNELFFEKKMKTETLINPHFYHNEKVKRDYFVTNARLEDTATLFKPQPVTNKTFGK